MLGMGISDKKLFRKRLNGIPAVPRNKKLSKFHSEPFRGRENNSEFRSVEQKYCRSKLSEFCSEHFAEENMLSFLFAGTGIFLFESHSQNGQPKISKKCEKRLVLTLGL
jgi:hypothetical protein